MMASKESRGLKRKYTRGSPTTEKNSHSHLASEVSRETPNRNDSDLPICKYGEKCYQKNYYHLTHYRHPHRTVATDTKKQISDKNRAKAIGDDESENDETKSTEKSGETLIQDPFDELPPSPRDIKENIKQKFLFDMPNDFYLLWEFTKLLSQENNLENSVGIKLVGPFEVLQGITDLSRSLSHYLTKWRYYYDPPEFQTVLVVDIPTGHHIGYFRDSPNEKPVFVGSNVESVGCVITPVSDNLFGAIRNLILQKLQTADSKQKPKLNFIKNEIENWACKHNMSLDNSSFKGRKKSIVAKTFYNSGIVVPFNKKTNVGYRPIPKTESELKKICKKIIESGNETERNKNADELQTLVTYVQYANDEMDYGMGLELGLDLLAYGGEAFHSTIEHLLGVAYELLERQEFFKILKAHLGKRRRLALL